MKKLVICFLFMFCIFSLFGQCLSGDCKQGNGVLIKASGERYIGAFLNSLPDGLGTYFYADGSRHFGYWLEGIAEGPGIRSEANGKNTRGHWRKGRLVKKDPQLIIEENGKVQLMKYGCIRGNCSSGNGIFLHPDGSIYSGDFKAGKKNGVGICYYPGQVIYRGNWANDLQNGRGTLQYGDGTKQVGIWLNGKLQKEAAQIDIADNKVILENKCLSGDCQNGYGVYQSKDGRKYEGPFKNGKPHGNGIYHFPTGERYEGYMMAGELNGKGALYFPDGRVIRGYWEKGKYVQSLEVDKSKPQQPQLIAPNSDIKVWAVVIGVAAYEHMPVLRFTDDDAYRFYAFLKSPEGGALPDNQIQLLIDESATRNNIIKAMTSVFGQASNKDLIILYFSGHGLPGAFLPIDYDGLNGKLFHQEISNILATSKAKFKVCIADACHSGGLLAMRNAGAEDTYLSYYNNLAQAQAGTALIMSSKSDETSLEARGLRHGVFSHYLIRGLKGESDFDKNKIVTVQELFNFVYKKVRQYTGNLQSPVIRGRYDPKMPISKLRK